MFVVFAQGVLPDLCAVGGREEAAGHLDAAGAELVRRQHLPRRRERVDVHESEHSLSCIHISNYTRDILYNFELNRKIRQ